MDARPVTRKKKPAQVPVEVMEETAEQETGAIETAEEDNNQGA